MALIDIKVPDIGDFKDVAVIELLVKPGDTVKAEQSLITVESDKAAMEIPCSHAGVVKELKIKLGDKVSEGSLLLVLDAAGSAAQPASVQASKENQTVAPVVSAQAATQTVASSAPTPTAASFGGTADLDCDLLVLGAGPGGYSAAFRAADLGLKDDYNYLKGAVRIFEEPIDGIEYIIGYDPVHQDYVLKPDSLACMYVYKPFIRGSSFSDCIVAEYTGRYVLTDKINEIAELLSLYYNKALIMMETNIRSNVEYFNRRGLLNLLSYKPIHTLESNMDKITQGNVFGYIKTTALVPILERFTCEWLEKEIGRIYTDVVNDSEGGTILRNMDFIYSKPLLEELISYNRE